MKKSGPTSGGVVALKTGRRQVPGSNPDRTCRPSLSEFSMVFFETRVSTDSDPLERPPTDDAAPIGPGNTSGQLTLNLQPNPTLEEIR